MTVCEKTVWVFLSLGSTTGWQDVVLHIVHVHVEKVARDLELCSRMSELELLGADRRQ